MYEYLFDKMKYGKRKYLCCQEFRINEDFTLI